MRIRVPHFNYMRYAKVGMCFSLMLTIACIALIVFKGFNFGLEFTGGATMELRFKEAVSVNQLREQVAKVSDHATVIQYGSSHDIQISFPEENGKDSDTLMQEMFSSIKAQHPDVSLQGQSKVGGQYKTELIENGVVALLLSCLGMVIYLAFRFEWKFAIGAVLAQLHDVIITAAIFSLMGWTFDLNVLAALLAVLGYSVNDTVVLYDRIRENMVKSPANPIAEIIDASITQTMMRTVITGLTTMLAVIALLFCGGETLFGFSAAMIVGIIVGTYSSIFVATSIAYGLRIQTQDFMPKQRQQLDDLP